jgi:protein-tyrosine phosphatase
VFQREAMDSSHESFNEKDLEKWGAGIPQPKLFIASQADDYSFRSIRTSRNWKMDTKTRSLSNMGQSLWRKLRVRPLTAFDFKGSSKSDSVLTFANDRSLNVDESLAVAKVLFVCTGNLCRSPTGQGVLEKLVTDAGLSAAIYIDSAGTHAGRGDSPDQRMQATALDRGYDLSEYRTRRATESDLDRFDYVLAMDRQNLNFLRELSAPDARDKVRLFMEFAPFHRETEVPDPYFGSLKGFNRVVDLIEDAARGLLQDIRNRYEL